MPDRQEIFSSLYGAFRLACFDENGLSYFNISVEGFWRSFFAALLLAPIYILSVGQDILTPEGGFSFWVLLVHFFTYVAGLVMFPLVAFLVTDLIGLGHRFTALVVAVNWSSILAFGLLTVSITFFSLLQQPALGDLILFVILTGLIVYHWFVIKTALETTTLIAIAFVLFDAVLGAMLHQLADRLL